MEEEEEDIAYYAVRLTIHFPFPYDSPSFAPTAREEEEEEGDDQEEEEEGGQYYLLRLTIFSFAHYFHSKSFVLSTIAFTCVTFVAGALAFWGPLFTQLGVKIQDHPNAKEDEYVTPDVIVSSSISRFYCFYLFLPLELFVF